MKALEPHVRLLYPDAADAVLGQLEQLIHAHRERSTARRIPPEARLSESDAVLITYGDQIRTATEAPLKTLRGFLRRHLMDAVSTVHLLPFYPYTSDDGFSVIDYLAIDPALGSWEDVRALRQDVKLMFDAVVNHVSAASPWFQAFLRDEAPYRDYFIAVDPTLDLSQVVRPRTTPLLTPFATPSGTKHVWTTFSADQIDLNYANPAVLIEVVRVLLEYIHQGADILRLDAVTYLWKEVGHPSVHHPKTHAVLKLMRAVVEAAAPHVVLLTETNVPHAENVSYFGDGFDEAQMVYNFALPPLVLYSVLTEDASALAAWAGTLTTPSRETCFFNFLASHDGIGVRPVEGILGAKGIAFLAERVVDHGGLVSHKTNPDGSQSPYELNISYFDALSDPKAEEPLAVQLERFVCAHAVMLALAGVPGIYVHSLLGSRSFHEGVKATGMKRSINREKFELTALERSLSDPATLRAQVLSRLKVLLRVRRSEKAFHPQAPQEVLASPREVFALRRGEDLYCYHNVSGKALSLPLTTSSARDLLTGERLDTLTLAPYGVRWLKC